MLGSVLAVVQVLVGVDMFMRGWQLVWLHIGIAVVLLVILLACIPLSRGSGRVRRHVIITLALLLIQGAVGLDMFMRGDGGIRETMHWVFGFATLGSYIGTASIARRHA